MRRPLLFVSLVMSALLIAAGVLITQSTARTPVTGTNGAKAVSTEPVLIELFTSQGCSSCPPADRLAARLAKEDGLVVISRPVDYWDRLGWKDTLASAANTALQRAYAGRRLAGYNGVYTPQSVVSGQLGEVGSDEPALRNLIRAARGDAYSSPVTIRANRVDGKGFAIGIAGETKASAELSLVAVSSREEIAIGRGENGGRTVGYTNVLLNEEVLARWAGGEKSVALYDGQLAVEGADRYALVLRVPKGGPVLAARWLR
ncbi:MAG: DUF1223 domain-containing protein [Erythrobacter sp.]